MKKIHLNEFHVSFTFFNVAVRKFLIAYVARITLQLVSVGLEGGRCQKRPEDSGQ